MLQVTIYTTYSILSIETIGDIEYMAKTVSVDELTYSQVVATAGKIMMLSGKPISLGFTVFMGMLTLDAFLENMDKTQTEKLKTLMKGAPSPKEMDEYMDSVAESIIGKKARKE